MIPFFKNRDGKKIFVIDDDDLYMGMSFFERANKVGVIDDTDLELIRKEFKNHKFFQRLIKTLR